MKEKIKDILNLIKRRKLIISIIVFLLIILSAITYEQTNSKIMYVIFSIFFWAVFGFFIIREVIKIIKGEYEGSSIGDVLVGIFGLAFLFIVGVVIFAIIKWAFSTVF